MPPLIEAFALLEEGGSAREIDAAMVDFGFPMGPLPLSDMTGIDIVVHAHRKLHKAFPYHRPPSDAALQLVAMALDTGFPNDRGGIVRYARDRGLDTIFADLENLTKTCSQPYAPSKHLRDLA